MPQQHPTMPSRRRSHELMGWRTRILHCRTSRRAIAAAFATLLLAAPGAEAQTVKLATLVPDGSVFHRILVDQAADWKRISGGKVELRLYPGGVAGDEPDMVRKMRVGQFQAATLTVAGLVEIDDAFRVFQIPLFYESPEELHHVVDRLTPVLRQRLEAKGFVLLHWGYAGWVHLYSKAPVRNVADLRAQKLFLWGGEERSMRIWRANRLQPVGLAATDIMMGLQTGMIEALGTTPLAALSLQWFRLAPNQLDEGLAPLMGGTVMARRAWNALPAEHRPALLQASQRAGQRFWKEVPPHEQRAVAEMRERGLTVTSIDPAARAEWRSVGESLANAYRGALVPDDVYDLARRAREDYRSRQNAATNR